MGGVATIYLSVMCLTWFGTYRAVQNEPTAHGQGILAPMGCLAGILWPVVVAYLVIMSPWIAFQWWQSRGER